MKVCNDTLMILKNFSGINSNFVVKPGNVIRTITGTKNIYAEATIAESFDKECSVFDLNKFLATISLFKEPEFKFDDKFVTIAGSGSSSVKYFYSDPSLVRKFVDDLPKTINAPTADFEFTLTAKDFQEISKAASVLQVNDLTIETIGGFVFLTLHDKKDASSNTYQIKVGENTGKLNFRMHYKMDNLKLVTGDYRVRISKKKVSEFIHSKLTLKYWVAMEHDSTWESK